MTYRPGDFILTHNTGLVPSLIRFGQRLKYGRGGWEWNHAALIVSADGDLIEAQAHGVQRSHITDYGHLIVVPVAASNEDRAQMVAFAEHLADTREQYGYCAFVSIALNLLTHISIRISRKRTVICSGLVAAALTRAGYLFDDGVDSSFVMPADLAHLFNVQ